MAAHRVLTVNRVLAVSRGEREGYLKVTLFVPDDRVLDRIRRRFARGSSEAARQVAMACADARSRLLFPPWSGSCGES